MRSLVTGLALLAVLVLGGGAEAGPSPATAAAEHGMVVSSQHLASMVGAGILAAGGNAVDAAVAVGYALAVVEPCCGNIGGGGFMTIHLADGRDTFINFRETAPAAARPGLFLDPGVPGTVMGLDRAAREYGTLPRAALMAPAIALARDGFVLTRDDTDLLDAKAALFPPRPAAAKNFLPAHGSPWAPGDRLVQSDLAHTLAAIARNGPDAFYNGAVARSVAAASRAHGGVMTAHDFAAYTATEGPPLTCFYRGFVVVTAPPPSSGGTTLCEILNILEGYDLARLGFLTPPMIEHVVAAMARAYADRNAFLGDPAFVANPLDRLLSKGYAAGVRAAIAAGAFAPPPPAGGPHERAETTHYSVADAAGNAVAVTYTINGYFGAGVVAPGTGFLLNNEMDDFTVKPGAPNLFGLEQGAANLVAGGKRPLSSMAPSLIEKDGQVILALGSPGGPRIITTVLETLLDIIDYRMSAAAAVAAPRFHYQDRPQIVFYERGGFSADTIASLTEHGYTVAAQHPWGAVELIAADHNRLYGVGDGRRRGGAAIGY